MEAPEFFHGGFYRSGTAGGGNHQFPQEKLHADDHFIIDDLLDFSNEDAVIEDAALFDNFAGNSTDSSTATIIDRCNSSFSGTDPHFSGDVPCRSYPDAQFSEELCVPYDDLAQLEWLSTFEEESFSTEDLQKLQLISGMKARPESESENREHQSVTIRNNPNFTQEIMTSVPGKARSKRSRAAPCNWSSRLLVLSPTTSSSESDPTAALNCSGKKTTSKGAMKKKESPENSTSGNGEGRKCLHCATDKTPQWRTGPMGPKTLCNACGVRYKSGRLVPEYRPAASPTFVLTQHSNSHRKVLELRRQKEMQTQLHQQPYVHGNGMFNVSSSNGEDYLIHHHHQHHHHHGGHDFRQLI